jgi:hypothetical protein
MDLINIAKTHHLQIVETTTAKNGYPQELRFAIVGFGYFCDAEELAYKYGLRITTLYKKDGWALWVRNNDTTYSPLEITCEEYGDDYRDYDGGSQRLYYEDEINSIDFNEFNNFSELKEFIDEREEVYNEIANATSDQLVITCNGRYFDTIDKRAMRWSFDTHNYIIALVQDNEE